VFGNKRKKLSTTTTKKRINYIPPKRGKGKAGSGDQGGKKRRGKSVWEGGGEAQLKKKVEQKGVGLSAGKKGENNTIKRWGGKNVITFCRQD